MCILGSREVTCIHPVVSKNSNKNDECRKLVKPLQHLRIDDDENSSMLWTQTARTKGSSSCSFYNKCKSNEFKSGSGHNTLTKIMGTENAWDMEDLVKTGRKNSFCPYFFAKDLLESAEIVFCPYNYLVDPGIRESMEIHLKDQVLLLDEAHNMEDFSREAAGFVMSVPDLKDILAELCFVAQSNDGVGRDCNYWHACHAELAVVASKLLQWLDDASTQTTDYSKHDKKSKVINGAEMIAVLKQCGITADTLKDFIGYFKETEVDLQDADVRKEDAMKYQHYLAQRAHPASINTIKNDCSKRREHNRLKKLQRLTGTPSHVLNRFTHLLKLFYQDFPTYVQDYRIAIITAIGEIKPLPEDHQQLDAIWLNARQSQGTAATTGWVITLHFWCLNPAVAFKYIKENTRSIVLTSGTLTPMDSFQSELDVKFPFQFSAKHVVSDSQIWVGALGVGPTNGELTATYNSTSTFEFQDECGRSVLEICQVVPNGVLCFFTSYHLLEKIASRWQETGQWDEIESRKMIFSEPRKCHSADFTKLVAEYNEAIRGNQFGVTGALFLAVYRGKLSEGIDFSDNAARAVISIGIPYPSYVDLQVQEKRKYNDQHKILRNLVNGQAWYEIQAFRALNQAFGRCIRHKNDWGAVVIIEDRFIKNQHLAAKLSKWVSSNLKHYQRFDAAVNCLSTFVRERKEVDDVEVSVEECGTERKVKGVVFIDSD